MIQFSDSAEFGGTEQSLLHLLRGVDRARWRSTLFHHPEPGLGPLLGAAQADGVELRAVPPLHRMRQIGGVPPLARRIRAEDPTVFHAHLTWPLSCRFGLLAAKRARVPVIVATAQLFMELDRSRPWHRAEQRLMAACVDRYLAVSDEVAERLQSSLRISARKIEVVRNGIPLDRFAGATPGALARTLPGDERPLVLTVARLDLQKGHTYLLQAAALVPDAVFALVGEGDQRAALEAQARGLGIQDRVLFLGHRTDIPELLAACDLFVLPSLFEGFPLSVLEAMAAGKAVIASDIGGTDEAVVHRETGILVPPGDAAVLAGAIRTLLGDSGMARRFGQAGQTKALREFSAERMVRRVSEIYEELLDARS